MAALAMVMAMCLLVYSLAQRQLRQALERVGEGIKNQVGKSTQRSIMRWVFQRFQSVHLLNLDGVKQITNLMPKRQLVLHFLGDRVGRTLAARLDKRKRRSLALGFQNGKTSV